MINKVSGVGCQVSGTAQICKVSLDSDAQMFSLTPDT
jgi:hypothetical protein